MLDAQMNGHKYLRLLRLISFGESPFLGWQIVAVTYHLFFCGHDVSKMTDLLPMTSKSLTA
jgi:hypothetical protein